MNVLTLQDCYAGPLRVWFQHDDSGKIMHQYVELKTGKERRPMKYAIISVCTVCVLFFIASCSSAQPTPVAGGYTVAPVSQEDVVAAAAFAIKAQQETSQDSKDGQAVRLELIKILDAEKQVVAGINYRLKLKVLVNGSEKLAEAVVWWQEWRKPDPYQLTFWKWVDP